MKHLLSDAKNETIKCQQADIVSDNEVNDLQEKLLKKEKHVQDFKAIEREVSREKEELREYFVRIQTRCP